MISVMNPNQKIGGVYAWFVWVLSVVFVILLFAMQTGYAITSPYLQSSARLSLSQIGLAASVYTWVFAISQFMGGALLDRLGLKKVFTGSAVILTLGIFLFANAQDFFMLLVAQIMLAIGACTGFVGAGFIGGDWFGPAKFNFMFGLVQAVVALFSGFSQSLLNFILTDSNWRHVLNGFGVFGISLSVLFLFFMRNRTPLVSSASKEHVIRGIMQSIWQVSKRSHVWFACVAGGTSFAVVLALGVVWLPKIFMAHAVSQSDANIYTSLLWIGLSAGSVVVTKLSDFLRGRKLILLASNIMTLLFFLILLYGPAQSSLLLATSSFILGFASAGHMLAFSTTADVVPSSEIGAASALVNGFMFILGGILIAVPGLLLDGVLTHVNQDVFFVFNILLSLSIVANFFMKDTYSTEMPSK